MHRNIISKISHTNPRESLKSRPLKYRGSGLEFRSGSGPSESG